MIEESQAFAHVRLDLERVNVVLANSNLNTAESEDSVNVAMLLMFVLRVAVCLPQRKAYQLLERRLKMTENATSSQVLLGLFENKSQTE